MDDQDDLDANNKAVMKPKTDNIPATIIANPTTTINSTPLIKRRWFKIMISFAAFVAFVAFIAQFTEIPNNIMGWFINWRTLNSKNPTSQQVPVVVVPQTHYIEGTSTTYQQLEDAFPFGYAVIYLNDARERRIHDVHNKLQDWKINWDDIKIEPDFGAGKVKWTLPTNFTVYHNGRTFTASDNVEIVTTPFKIGEEELKGFYVDYDDRKFGPMAYIGILSVNQMNPVFVIGFRIPRPEEQKQWPQQ